MKRMHLLYPAFILCVGAALLAGCQSLGIGSRPSLYERLGEREGISGLNEELLLITASDPRIAGDFRRTDINRLHFMLTDYICERVGGPCEYTGASMIDVHRGQNVTSADFNALVENLVLAMEARGIPTRTQNELLARLAPLRRDVVRAPPPPSPELEALILGDILPSSYSAQPSEGL